MDRQRRARLSGRNRIVAWLADPTADVPAKMRPILYGSLLSASTSVILGALSGLLVTVTAAICTQATKFQILALIEVVLLLLRLRAIRRAHRHFRAGTLPSIDRTIALTIGWCALQGITAFAIATTGDLALIVIATAYILGLVAPICSRNQVAPRLAVTLVMLCDLPFKLGLTLSGQPILWVLIPLCAPLFISVRVLLRNFAELIAASLNAAERNRILARQDPLTGVANRYGLDRELARLTETRDRPLTLLCLDLDRFKPINDQYGHAAGDAVLVEVADRLRHVAGDDAVIARLGGDEFLLAISDLPPDEAHPFAERVARAVGGRRYPLGTGERIEVGVSIGYACFPQDSDDATTLRNLADKALYAAKRSGGVHRHVAPSSIDNVA